VRDSSFSSRALAEIGAVEEADSFREFIMRSAAGDAEELQIVYGVGGERRFKGRELDLGRGTAGPRRS
jgi:GH15 family glucan-1,4-alpha-glucosidase